MRFFPDTPILTSQSRALARNVEFRKLQKYEACKRVLST